MKEAAKKVFSWDFAQPKRFPANSKDKILKNKHKKLKGPLKQHTNKLQMEQLKESLLWVW